jgi:hypothetical protein
MPSVGRRVCACLAQADASIVLASGTSLPVHNVARYGAILALSKPCDTRPVSPV